MDETLKELQEKRGQLAKSMREHADKQANWTAEDRVKWDELNAAYDANKKELDEVRAKAEAAAAERTKIEQRLAEVGNYQDFQPAARRIGRDGGRLNDRQPNADGLFALALQGWMRAAGPGRGEVTDEHRAAAASCGVNLAWNELTIKLAPDFNRVRAGFKARNFRNTLSGQDGRQGGYTYGETFVGRLEEAMLAYGGMMEVAEIIRTASGEPMRWPTANDTANSGRQIGESAAVTGLDPAFAQVIWNSYKFTSDEILVPFELLRDNAVNLEGVLPRMLGTRLGRIQNSKYTNGTGAGTPKGITVCASAGVTAASATAIAFDELIDLEHSLDPSRRAMPGVGYMFHDSILKALRKLKDGEGRYLWQSGANSGAPDTLNTYPYTINQDMASSIAASAITVLFGELPMYKVRQVGQIRLYRLVERYRENDQDAFLAFAEGDGNLLDAGDHPVKKLTQHS